MPLNIFFLYYSADKPLSVLFLKRESKKYMRGMYYHFLCPYLPNDNLNGRCSCGSQPCNKIYQNSIYFYDLTWTPTKLTPEISKFIRSWHYTDSKLFMFSKELKVQDGFVLLQHCESGCNFPCLFGMTMTMIIYAVRGAGGGPPPGRKYLLIKMQ